MDDLDYGPLLHALGLDAEHEEPYRDHYVTGPDGDPSIDALVADGLMEERRRPGFLAKDDRVFGATEQGRVRAIDVNRARRPKLSASQLRYRAWLDADSGLSFGEWLRGRTLHAG